MATPIVSNFVNKTLTMKRASLLLFLSFGVQHPTKDETAIRALEARFVAAFNTGNVDAIMKNYLPGKDLVVFDVVPRDQYLGAEAYKKDWQEFFSHFSGTPKITVNDLGI